MGFDRQKKKKFRKKTLKKGIGVGKKPAYKIIIYLGSRVSVTVNLKPLKKLKELIDCKFNLY